MLTHCSPALHCFPVSVQTTLSTNNLVALVLLTFLGASGVSGLVYSPNSFEISSQASVRRTSAGMSGIAPRSVLMLQQQLKGPCAARFFLRRAHLPVCEATHVDETSRSEALMALGTRNALGRNALSSHARRKSAQ
jgi:hypothetical protein